MLAYMITVAALRGSLLSFQTRRALGQGFLPFSERLVLPDDGVRHVGNSMKIYEGDVLILSHISRACRTYM
jgi:hypothetical protein